MKFALVDDGSTCTNGLARRLSLGTVENSTLSQDGGVESGLQSDPGIKEEESGCVDPKARQGVYYKHVQNLSQTRPGTWGTACTV